MYCVLYCFNRNTVIERAGKAPLTFGAVPATPREREEGVNKRLQPS